MTAPVSLLAELASMARPGAEDEELREIRLPRFDEADQVARQIVLLEEPLRITAESRLSEAALAFMRRHWDYDETWQQGISRTSRRRMTTPRSCCWPSRSRASTRASTSAWPSGCGWQSSCGCCRPRQPSRTARARHGQRRTEM